MKVSVIIINRNDSRWLPEAIQSVSCQTFQDYELIIVDDASTDSSRDIILAAAKDNQRIKPLLLDTPSGISLARNLGMDQAQGEYISLLDSDDRMLPETLQKQLDAFLEAQSKCPSVRLLTSDAYAINEEGKRCSRYMPVEYWDRSFFPENAPLFTLPSTWFFEKSPELRFQPAWTVGESTAFILPIAAKNGVYYDGQPLIEYRWRINSVTNHRAQAVLQAFNAASETHRLGLWANPILPQQGKLPKWNEVMGWKYGRTSQSYFFNGKKVQATCYLLLALFAQPKLTGSKIARAINRIFRKFVRKS